MRCRGPRMAKLDMGEHKSDCPFRLTIRSLRVVPELTQDCRRNWNEVRSTVRRALAVWSRYLCDAALLRMAAGAPDVKKSWRLFRLKKTNRLPRLRNMVFWNRASARLTFDEMRSGQGAASKMLGSRELKSVPAHYPAELRIPCGQKRSHSRLLRLRRCPACPHCTRALHKQSLPSDQTKKTATLRLSRRCTSRRSQRRDAEYIDSEFALDPSA